MFQNLLAKLLDCLVEEIDGPTLKAEESRVQAIVRPSRI